MDLKQIIDGFVIDGVITECEPFGTGHINDSYHLVNADPNKPDYLLQKINHHVFKDVPGLMQNINQVTSHIRKKRRMSDVNDDKDSVLSLIYTHDGGLFYPDGGCFWRVFRFIKNTVSSDHAETPSQAYEGARAFGSFLTDLSDFPGNKLAITIPGFHDLKLRLEQLSQAVPTANRERLLASKDLLSFIHNYADDLLVFHKLTLLNRIPSRVTHNDTKFNNVLLTANRRTACVIDLDTVMPGIVHYDFGDGVRTGAVACEEDEPDLSLIELDQHRYEAFTAGYLETTRKVLTPIEIDHLPLAGAFMAFIMGVRFITDYLNGDIYYKIQFPDHNLQRAANQLHLGKIMLKRKKDLKTIIQYHV
ncbi:aminoglycoside phosphotransferase family protein [Fulvivirga sp. M361]|uniref:phosphotransferase enzyme family protein n=1 Tax=Fulvivirga sp. M361 TaxID=2594266 RepID=UPI00117A4FB2|nr:aminoglycoside phosphotransferase family protein [Fulvivirga sp. M361]TRX49674.1 aminoglycoside phosphotransferase family protein [Fulvivirga sp. M361]